MTSTHFMHSLSPAAHTYLGGKLGEFTRNAIRGSGQIIGGLALVLVALLALGVDFYLLMQARVEEVASPIDGSVDPSQLGKLIVICMQGAIVVFGFHFSIRSKWVRNLLALVMFVAGLLFIAALVVVTSVGDAPAYMMAAGVVTEAMGWAADQVAASVDISKYGPVIELATWALNLPYIVVPLFAVLTGTIAYRLLALGWQALHEYVAFRGMWDHLNEKLAACETARAKIAGIEENERFELMAAGQTIIGKTAKVADAIKRYCAVIGPDLDATSYGSLLTDLFEELEDFPLADATEALRLAGEAESELQNGFLQRAYETWRLSRDIDAGLTAAGGAA